jgi:hypothetical protein
VHANASSSSSPSSSRVPFPLVLAFTEVDLLLAFPTHLLADLEKRYTVILVVVNNKLMYRQEGIKVTLYCHLYLWILFNYSKTLSDRNLTKK